MSTKRPSRAGSILTALFCIAGTLACGLPAAFLGVALNDFPGSDCQPEIGSGCGTDNVFLMSLLFLRMFFPWTAGSLALAQLHRRHAVPALKWWPFVVQVSAPMLLVVMSALTSS